MNKSFFLILTVFLLSLTACNNCEIDTICADALSQMTSGQFAGTIDLVNTNGQTVATYNASASLAGSIDQVNISVLADSASGIDTILALGLICNVINEDDCALAMAIVDYKSTGSYTATPTEMLSFNFDYNGLDAHFEGVK